MQINTQVVIALMTLKQVDLASLALVTGLSARKLEAWLAGSQDNDAATALSPDLQMSVLQALGVSGGSPRPDMMHLWTIREPLIGSRAEAWASLEIAVAAFGGQAEVVYAAAEADPFFSLTPSTTYILRFPGFTATLNIVTSLLRPAAFTPDRVKGLRWMEGTLGVLLSQDEFTELRDGEVMPEPMQQLLIQTTEPSRWAQLQDTARSKGVSPEALVQVLTAMSDNLLTSNREGSAPITGSERLAAALNGEVAPSLAEPMETAGSVPMFRPVASATEKRGVPPARQTGLFVVPGA